jgi:hypothetical protein
LVSIQTVLSYCLRRVFHKGLERFFGYFDNYISTAKGNNAVKLKGEQVGILEVPMRDCCEVTYQRSTEQTEKR